MNFPTISVKLLDLNQVRVEQGGPDRPAAPDAGLRRSHVGHGQSPAHPGGTGWGGVKIISLFAIRKEGVGCWWSMKTLKMTVFLYYKKKTSNYSSVMKFILVLNYVQSPLLCLLLRCCGSTLGRFGTSRWCTSPWQCSLRPKKTTS